MSDTKFQRADFFDGLWNESLILCNELKANFILIDEKRAGNIAESFGANCIEMLGLLSVAKEIGLILE